ncbi:hypothetical protein CLOBOL_04169 [Enterocloster bolteae ATCC BAA-613]|uniref:Uncharacterized protein n=1 Tax=Enterocloster bolteae (strain ATCC BAA-613 / DSM 15670 / CCUG 46953 / JCM 12243 / WAL 16351) TaxID=411902 RepID=A8RUZ8_ENTBW|nr:hypothetical protein CLOBOL_04169 [Enterocloster bolteae ATCC BAA-613]
MESYQRTWIRHWNHTYMEGLTFTSALFCFQGKYVRVSFSMGKSTL